MASSGLHDIGGLELEYGVIDRREREYQMWEKQTHAILVLLSQKGLLTTDELRRAIEALPGQTKMSYYHRWAAAMVAISIERGTFTSKEWSEIQGILQHSRLHPNLAVGQKVRVKRENSKVRWRKPHLRTPGYLFGATGVVKTVLGVFDNPEEKAFRDSHPSTCQPLYLVEFERRSLWKGFDISGKDKVTAEIYETWLEALEDNEEIEDEKNVIRDLNFDTSTVHHDDHVHEKRFDVEVEALRREMLNSDPVGKRFSENLMKILLQKNKISKVGLRSIVEKMDVSGKILHGQTLTVKAWTDKAFKERLLRNANAAAAELGINASNPNAPTKLAVVENSDSVHHLIVCTLCSCYPTPILGMAPDWYKSRSYRARAVREPRQVLNEFGLDIPVNKTVVVHDSTADCRYMVLPMRPAYTSNWNEQALLSIVTRDCLLGVAIPTSKGTVEAKM